MSRVLGGLLAVLLVGSAPAAARADEFRVLTYNVHGLADFLVDDRPTERMPRISERLAPYDVVLLQEDWSHHDALVGDAGHAVVLRGSPSRFALGSWLPLLQGSGLTLLTRRADALRDGLAEPLPGCSGWWSGANDCWATKGFVAARLALSPGVTVDFYTTHLDAGGGDEDQAAREGQLSRLQERIAAWSDRRAVVVGGDFNLHHDRPAHRDALERFAHALGLTRSAAHGDPARWKSRVDYLFYRSGSGTRLELLEAGEAREFVHDDAPLSDHPALFGRFTLHPSR